MRPVIKREVKFELEDGYTLTPRKGIRVKKEPGENTTPPKTPTRGNETSRRRGNVAFQKYYTKANWAKRLVWRGVKSRTSTGLRKRDLICNARGRIVSKKISAKSKRLYRQNNLDLWTQAAKEVREERGFRGFVMQKKFGTSSQRRFYLEIRNRWLDAIAERVVGAVSGQPEMVERIRQLAQGSDPGKDKDAN